MAEIWKTVPGRPWYQVSNRGRVKALAKTIPTIRHGKPTVRRYPEKLLSLAVAKSGYQVVVLYHRSKSPRTCTVHRLVARSFLGKPPAGKTSVLHLDNKLNNRIKNLRWGSSQDNADDMVSKSRQTLGIRNPRAILTEKDVRRIAAMLKKGMRGADIARTVGISQGTVCNIKKGHTWSHVTNFPRIGAST